MKKLLLVALAVGFMSTNAMAWWMNGASITDVRVQPSGDVYLSLLDASNNASTRKIVVDTDDVKKMFLAGAMTQMSTAGKVDLWISSGTITNIILVKP